MQISPDTLSTAMEKAEGKTKLSEGLRREYDSFFQPMEEELYNDEAGWVAEQADVATPATRLVVATARVKGGGERAAWLAAAAEEEEEEAPVVVAAVVTAAAAAAAAAAEAVAYCSHPRVLRLVHGGWRHHCSCR